MKKKKKKIQIDYRKYMTYDLDLWKNIKHKLLFYAVSLYDPAFDCVEKCSFKVRIETELFQALMIYNLRV